jgi:hypothetical protein
MDLLAEPKKLLYSASGTSGDTFAPFIEARQKAGCTVTVIHRPSHGFFGRTIELPCMEFFHRLDLYSYACRRSSLPQPYAFSVVENIAAPNIPHIEVTSYVPASLVSFIRTLTTP